jgi:hypothetical protein
MPWTRIDPSFADDALSDDCNMHGNLGKASLDLQAELAIQRERDGFWNQVDGSNITDEDDNKKRPPDQTASIKRSSSSDEQSDNIEAKTADNHALRRSIRYS